MAEKISITPPPALTAVAGALARAGHDAVLVGGVVRDAALGVTSNDWDVVTDADPREVRALCGELEGVRAVYDLGEKFGTVGIVLIDGGKVEMTLFRPDALQAPTLAERFAIDAGHRDLTVNALGYDLATGELLDPLGALEDLRAGVLRAPGNPHDRLAEDPIRCLRVARFVAELGFEVEPATLSAIPAVAPRLADVAGERIREELTKLLVARCAREALTLLLRTGSLAVVLPEVAALDGIDQPSFHDLDVFAHTAQAVGLAPPTPVLRWAALLHDVGKAPAMTVDPDGRIRFFHHAQMGAQIAEQICLRLHMSNRERGAIVHLVGEHMRLGDVDANNLRAVDRAVRKLDLAPDPTRSPIATAEDAAALTVADIGATAHREEAPQRAREINGMIAQSRERGTNKPLRPPINGEQLMEELGIKEGPAVGRAMQAIVDAIESGALANDDSLGALEVARRFL